MIKRYKKKYNDAKSILERDEICTYCGGNLIKKYHCTSCGLDITSNTYKIIGVEEVLKNGNNGERKEDC